jgi:hypothetical protein
VFCREYPNATPYSLYVTSCCLVAVYHVSPLSLNSSHSRTTNQPAQSRSVHPTDVNRDRASQDFVRELVSLDRGSARLTSSPCTANTHLTPIAIQNGDHRVSASQYRTSEPLLSA